MLLIYAMCRYFFIRLHFAFKKRVYLVLMFILIEYISEPRYEMAFLCDLTSTTTFKNFGLPHSCQWSIFKQHENVRKPLVSLFSGDIETEHSREMGLDIGKRTLNKCNMLFDLSVINFACSTNNFHFLFLIFLQVVYLGFLITTFLKINIYNIYQLDIPIK